MAILAVTGSGIISTIAPSVAILTVTGYGTIPTISSTVAILTVSGYDTIPTISPIAAVSTITGASRKDWFLQRVVAFKESYLCSHWVLNLVNFSRIAI